MNKIRNTFLVVIVILTIIIFSPLANSRCMAASNAKTVFNATEPNENGVFYVEMSIHNATFNTMQFALKYNKATAIPCTASGEAASAFSQFANLLSSASGISSIGVSLDTDSGLIEFAGYLTPGSAINTDGLAKIPGQIVTGSNGLNIYSFRFKKISEGDFNLQIAAKKSGIPYSNSLPEGAGLFNAGESIPFVVEFDLPSSVGNSSSVTPEKQEEPVVMTKQERLRRTLALQIGNYGAAAEGTLIHIDPNNKNVVPYLDENDRTMVPVRFIAEQLGASVLWDAQQEKITIESEARTIVMYVGSKTYTVNGVSSFMDTAPVIRSGWNRTMVPIRFVTEALGMAVEWDAAYSIVFITQPDTPWQLDRQAEKDATDGILFVISPGMRDFI